MFILIYHSLEAKKQQFLHMQAPIHYFIATTVDPREQVYQEAENNLLN